MPLMSLGQASSARLRSLARKNTGFCTDMSRPLRFFFSFVFFFNDTATTEIYTLSLHDALPISKEIQYLNAKGALTYTDIAGDPVLYGNLPPREISMKDVFRSGDSSKKFKIAEGQWYRYAPSYVSPAYHLLEGFPFIQEP